MGALALTDRDSVTGAVRHAKACMQAGVRPIFGVDLAVAAHASRPAASRRPRTPLRGGAHVLEPPLRVTVPACSAAGWGRLCRLVSAAHANPVDGFPLASWDALREYLGEGLLVLLGPASEPVRALTAGRPDLAEELLAPWQAAVGEGVTWSSAAMPEGAPSPDPGVRGAAHASPRSVRLFHALRRIPSRGLGAESRRAGHGVDRSDGSRQRHRGRSVREVVRSAWSAPDLRR